MRRVGLAALVGISAAATAWAAFSFAVHDANRVSLRVTNRGGIGLSSGPNDPIGNFPIGSTNRYLFGAGLWIGGVVDPDGDGDPDTVTTVGYNPQATGNVEWIEGVVGFDRNDARFRVLRSTDAFFPGDPVASQELFTVYRDAQPVGSGGLGVEVRQRSFAFDEPGLDSAIVFQWDVTNVTTEVADVPFEILDVAFGVVLDPDIGRVSDDIASPLRVDGEPVLLIWDSDFFAASFSAVGPGFLAIVPLDGPGHESATITQLAPPGAVPDVQEVPIADPARYRAMRGLAPREPTVGEPGFDLRALAGWGVADLAPGETRRAAAAFMWADVAADPPELLSPFDPVLGEDAPFLANLVDAVRAVRTAYEARLETLPALLDFPEDLPFEPDPGDADELLQNFPNPFSDRTTIVFRVAEAGEARLDVFDVTGRVVSTLASGFHGEGTVTVTWDGRVDAGFEAPNGVYVARLVTPRVTRSIRLLKVR